MVNLEAISYMEISGDLTKIIGWTSPPYCEDLNAITLCDISEVHFDEEKDRYNYIMERLENILLLL